MNKKLIILGAGGHAKVAIETAQRCGYEPCAVYDDDESLIGTVVSNIPVVATIKSLPADLAEQAIIAIGSNRVRRLIAERLKNISWVTLKHPAAYICQSAKIGKGTIICAGATIQPDVAIGDHVIINTGANIDHDCIIEDFCHICPGSTLAGGCKINAGAMLGTGCSVIPLKTIGENTIIGAGATVISNIPPNTTAIGTPAKFQNSGSDQEEVLDRAGAGPKKD